MPIYTIQRDAENFEDPDAFIPERWVEGTPEAAANKRIPGSWMAFGEGSRSCVGLRFALQEAKITLARLFQRCAGAYFGSFPCRWVCFREHACMPLACLACIMHA
jgi:cytochrome P450